MNNLENALFWANLGFYIFPCEGKGKSYRIPIRGIKWSEQSTIDEDKIISWWNSYPYAIASLNLKRSRYFIVDCDVKNGEDGVNNFLNLLRELSIDESKIFQVQTPSGGRHFYFKIPDDIKTIKYHSSYLPGVEIKGNTTCIIAGGSVTHEGLSYKKINDVHIHDTLTLTLPNLKNDNDINQQPCDNVCKLSNYFSTNSHYYEKALMNEIDNIKSCLPGSRNNTLHISSFKLGTLVGAGKLNKDRCFDALLSAARSIGLKDHESKATINSGMKYGIKNPRHVPKSIHDSPIHIKRIDDNDKILINITNTVKKNEKNNILLYNNINDGEVKVNSKVYNDLMSYLKNNAYKYHESLAHGSILSLLSTLIGREVYTPTNSSTCLYNILVANTGSGKDSYLKFPLDMLCTCELKDMIGNSNFSSSVYLEQTLKEKKVSLNIIDEFNVFLKKVTGTKANISEQEISATLKKLWSIDYHQLLITAGSMSRQAYHINTPFFNLLGAVTSKALFDDMQEISFSDGFINRFIFFESDNPMLSIEELKLRENIQHRVIDEETILQLQQMFNLTRNSCEKLNDIPPDKIIIPWKDENAKDLFYQLVYDINNLINNNQSDAELCVRMAESSLRIATIIAVSRDFLNAKITVDDMKVGIYFVNKSISFLRNGIKKHMFKNLNEKQIKQVRNIIFDAKDNGVAKSEIIKKSPSINRKQRDEILYDLIESEEIEVLEVVSENNKKKYIYISKEIYDNAKN